MTAASSTGTRKLGPPLLHGVERDDRGADGAPIRPSSHGNRRRTCARAHRGHQRRLAARAAGSGARASKHADAASLDATDSARAPSRARTRSRRIAISCCLQGVRADRGSRAFRSCRLSPPTAAAQRTTAPIMIARDRRRAASRCRATAISISEANRIVAMVMPETGLFDEPDQTGHVRGHRRRTGTGDRS